MRTGVWLLLAFSAVMTGCSTLWPAVVRPSPEEPVFHASLLAGGSGTDGALCSLSTIGPEVTLVIRPPESTGGAIPLEQACSREVPDFDAQHGRIAQMVSISTPSGPLFGYLFRAQAANGIVVAFSGMGMPAGGWVNARFAEAAARRGLITFAPIRDEAARPIYFDPLREARRAIDAAQQIGVACRSAAPQNIRFVGISLGGLEALLANRESLHQGLDTRVAALDPVLDVEKVTANLDSYWHSFPVDTMQAFFRRILSGRYGEWPTPSFHDVMNRIRSHPEAITDLGRDVPSIWLCSAPRNAYAIFLSDEDPVLGESQREFAQACNLPIWPACAPGHTPLACRPELFEEMIAAVHATDGAAPPPGITCPRSPTAFQPPRDGTPAFAQWFSPVTRAPSMRPATPLTRAPHERD